MSSPVGFLMAIFCKLIVSVGARWPSSPLTTTSLKKGRMPPWNFLTKDEKDLWRNGTVPNSQWSGFYYEHCVVLFYNVVHMHVFRAFWSVFDVQLTFALFFMTEMLHVMSCEEKAWIETSFMLKLVLTSMRTSVQTFPQKKIRKLNWKRFSDQSLSNVQHWLAIWSTQSRQIHQSTVKHSV